MVKVAVFSAYYNRARYVRRTVESILNQTFGDFEFYVINDGSKDETASELAKFDDLRLHAVNQDNMGFVRSMIKAIAESDSEYIAILGSGDEAVPTRLEKQAAFLDGNPGIGLVGSYIERVGVGGEYREIGRPELGEDPAETLLVRGLYSQTDVMFRRDIYDRVGGYRDFFTYSQDNDLWLRMSEITGLGQIPEVLTVTYKLQDGVTVVPEKLTLARILRDFAVFCAKERRAGRPDPLEQFGPAAALLRPRSAHLARVLARDAVKLAFRGNPAASGVAKMSLRESVTPQGVVALVASHIPHVHFARAAYKALKLQGS